VARKKVIHNIGRCLDIIVVNFSWLAIQCWIIDSHKVEDGVILVFLQTSNVDRDVVIPIFHVDLIKLRNGRKVPLLYHILRRNGHCQRVEYFRHIGQDEIGGDHSYIDCTADNTRSYRKAATDNCRIICVNERRTELLIYLHGDERVRRNVLDVLFIDGQILRKDGEYIGSNYSIAINVEIVAI
jgi:hypothetical protein